MMKMRKRKVESLTIKMIKNMIRRMINNKKMIMTRKETVIKQTMKNMMSKIMRMRMRTRNKIKIMEMIISLNPLEAVLKQQEHLKEMSMILIVKMNKRRKKIKKVNIFKNKNLPKIVKRTRIKCLRIKSRKYSRKSASVKVKPIQILRILREMITLRALLTKVMIIQQFYRKTNLKSRLSKTGMIRADISIEINLMMNKMIYKDKEQKVEELLKLITRKRDQTKQMNLQLLKEVPKIPTEEELNMMIMRRTLETIIQRISLRIRMTRTVMKNRKSYLKYQTMRMTTRMMRIMIMMMEFQGTQLNLRNRAEEVKERIEIKVHRITLLIYLILMYFLWEG